MLNMTKRIAVFAVILSLALALATGCSGGDEVQSKTNDQGMRGSLPQPANEAASTAATDSASQPANSGMPANIEVLDDDEPFMEGGVEGEMESEMEDFLDDMDKELEGKGNDKPSSSEGSGKDKADKKPTDAKP